MVKKENLNIFKMAMASTLEYVGSLVLLLFLFVFFGFGVYIFAYSYTQDFVRAVFPALIAVVFFLIHSDRIEDADQIMKRYMKENGKR